MIILKHSPTLRRAHSHLFHWRIKSTVLFILPAELLWWDSFPANTSAAFLSPENLLCWLSVIWVVTFPIVSFLQAHVWHSPHSLQDILLSSSHFVTVVLCVHAKPRGQMLSPFPREMGRTITMVKSDSCFLLWTSFCVPKRSKETSRVPHVEKQKTPRLSVCPKADVIAS